MLRRSPQGASEDSNPDANDLALSARQNDQRNEHDAIWLPSMDTFRTLAA
jgi:hypothetical protein